jgi:hypothetical protein
VRNPEGYAALTGLQGKTQIGHRLMYELTKGPIPDGYEVDHLCSRPPCINPDHLEAVPSAVNKRRVWERGHGRNQNTGKTTCPRGHEYDRVNTRGDGRTFRACSTCQKASWERHLARRAAAKVDTAIPPG